MLNKFIAIGYLSKDPEIRTTPSGIAVCKINVAINTKVKVGEETKEDVLFIDCIAFNKQAEACANYLTKGSQVLIDGRLKERSWEYEGRRYNKMEVLLTNIRFLKTDKKKKDEENDSEAMDYTVDDDTPF